MGVPRRPDLLIARLRISQHFEESLQSQRACIGTMNRRDWSAGGSPAPLEEAANFASEPPALRWVGSWRGQRRR